MNQPIEIRIISDIETCRRNWELLSPKKTIYDDWNFRYCFYKYFNYPLFFYTGYIDNECIGFLPLQFNPIEQHLEFFGGTYMEDNRVFIKEGYEAHVPDFYIHIDQPVKLESILSQEPWTRSLPILDYKYTLSLDNITSFDDYIKQHPGDTLKKVGQKARKVEREMQPVIVENNLADIDVMFEYNKQHFGAHSSFNDRPYHSKIFRDLLHMNYGVFLRTFMNGTDTIAISFSLLYNDTYEYINLGIRDEQLRDLTTYVHVYNINQAIHAGARTLDASMGDYGWKERWKLNKIPQHLYEHTP